MEEVYDELYENADKIDLEDLVDQLLDEHLDSEEGGKGGGKPIEDENGNPVSKSKSLYKRTKTRNT